MPALGVQQILLVAHSWCSDCLRERSMEYCVALCQLRFYLFESHRFVPIWACGGSVGLDSMPH